MPEDLSTEIRSYVAAKAREGYATDDEIVRRALDWFRDDYPDRADLDALVQRESGPVLDEAARAEVAWAIPTDCDRLDRAFAALQRAGVVARQNFTCCQGCGHAEIRDEIEAAGGPANVHGYTFFHEQDTESAAEGYGICLAYGAVLPEDATDDAYQRAAVEVGHEIVRALAREGLATTWNGELSKRITVKLDWKRRRPRR